MISAKRSHLTYGIVTALALTLAVVATAQSEGTLATLSVSASRLYWTPVVGYKCLDLTVTTPDPDQTFQKRFASGEYPAYDLPAGSRDGSYGWRLTRSDRACPTAVNTVAQSPSTNAVSTTSAASADDDANGRPTGHARTASIASGPYSQEGRLRVQQGSFVIPSNAPEAGGHR